MTASAVPSWTPMEMPVYRITVDQYHEMIRQGILRNGERVELIEGILVQKMGRNPPHRVASQSLRDLIPPMLPPGWFVDDQEEVTTSDSAPEPDIGLFRGNRKAIGAQGRHPGPEDTAIVMEVSDTTLAYDSGTKKRVYARAMIPEYWIVNVGARRIEVYTDPTGPGESPTYLQRKDFLEGDKVPIRLDSHEIGHVAVSDLFI